MENTMLIQVTNQKAVGLLHELESLHLIKVLKDNISDTLLLLNLTLRVNTKAPSFLTPSQSELMFYSALQLLPWSTLLSLFVV